MTTISVTILTKNSERMMRDVLASLQAFDEIIILDSGSSDHTLEIARTFPNVRVHASPFLGFGKQHNLASSCATHDWILSIDSDEIASQELVNEILSLNLQNTKVYSLPRLNFYRGKLVKWCGWQNERVLRLYNRKATRFSDAEVHEKIMTEGLSIMPLKHPLHHTPYTSIADFLAKMQHYSTLFAEQYRGVRKSSPWIALGHGFFAFFKSYFLKGGIFGGYVGFLISAYNGHTAFYKYLKLYEVYTQVT